MQQNENFYTNFNKVSYISLIKSFLEAGSIIVAIKIGLFEYLSQGFQSPSQIIQALNLKCKERNLMDLLNKLFVIGILTKISAKPEETHFKCTNSLFQRENPLNLIPYFLMLDRFLKRLTRFDELLTQGEILNFQDPFTMIYSNETDTWAFLNSMSLMHQKQFEQIVNKFDFTPYKSMVDIGGALGLFSILVKKTHSKIKCTTFDIPKIESFVKKFIENHELSGQIDIVSGDMFIDNYPKTDLIVMTNLTNDWNQEKKHILYKKAYEALNEGGAFMIIEEFLQKNSENDDYGLNLSLYMFVECNDGFNITVQEAENYAKIAGFTKIQDITSAIGTSGIICFK